MAAMMAVTAVPATTVLAAAPSAAETVTGSGYKAVLNTNGTVDVYTADGNKVDDVKATGFSATTRGTSETGSLDIKDVNGNVQHYATVTLKAVNVPNIEVKSLFGDKKATTDPKTGEIFTDENGTFAPVILVNGQISDKVNWKLTKEYGNKEEFSAPTEEGYYVLSVSVKGLDGYDDLTKDFIFYNNTDNSSTPDAKYTTESKTWGHNAVLEVSDNTGEHRTPSQVLEVTQNGKKVAGAFGFAPVQGKEGQYEITGTDKLDPGKYTVAVSFNADNNYGSAKAVASQKFDFEVKKRDLKVSTSPSKLEVMYSGKAYYPTRAPYIYSLTDSEKGTPVTPKNITVAGAKKDTDGYQYVVDSGNYTVTFTLSDADAKKYNAPANVTFGVVGGLEQTVTLNVYDKYYDGDPVNVTAHGQTSAKATFTYKDANGKDLGSNAPTDAGTYTVTATVPGDKNYKSGSTAKQFTIYQTPLYANEISNALNSGEPLKYDGKKQIPDSTLDVSKAVPKQIDLGKISKLKLNSAKDFKLEIAKGDDGTYVGDHTATFTLVNKNYKLVDSSVEYDYKKDQSGAEDNVPRPNGKDTEVSSVPVTYNIVAYDISAYKDNTLVTVEDAEPGKTPVVHVYAEDGNEIPSDDYTVKAYNNSKVGKGYVTVAGVKNAKAGVQNVRGSKNVKFNVVAQATVEKTDLYRLYNKNTGEHFFTTNASEKNNLVSKGWNFEGIAMKTVKDGGTPVYRLYNKNNGGEHVYTTSKGEANSLVRAGWAYEGVAFNAAKKGDKDAVKVYRVYNPNKVANNHHYTQSWGEKTVLVKQGWRDEGVAFYAYKAL